MNRRHLAPKAERAGFTLVEMLVVLVVLAILTGMATPRMNGLLTRNRLDQAANQVVGDIAYARMVAVRSGHRINVEFSATGYHIAQLETDGATRVVKVVKLAEEHPGMRVTVEDRVGATPGTLTFDSRGVLRQGQGLQVVLHRDGQVAALNVSSAGKVERAN